MKYILRQVAASKRKIIRIKTSSFVQWSCFFEMKSSDLLNRKRLECRFFIGIFVEFTTVKRLNRYVCHLSSSYVCHLAHTLLAIKLILCFFLSDLAQCSVQSKSCYTLNVSFTQCYAISNSIVGFCTSSIHNSCSLSNLKLFKLIIAWEYRVRCVCVCVCVHCAQS